VDARPFWEKSPRGNAAPVLFVIGGVVGGGAGYVRLTREWLPGKRLYFAACLYVVNPYTLFVAYERGPSGELLAADGCRG